MSTRRTFLQRTAALGAALFAADRPASASTHDPHAAGPQVAPKGGYLGTASGSLSKVNTHSGPFPTVPVVTTDVGDLPFEWEGDVKVFRLTAHVLKQQIAPDKTIDVWGFNGSSPGPTIQVTQGDRVKVIFKNELPEPSSIHWHGFEDHIGFDGMPGISQEPVKPGETFEYHFTIHQEGTFFYHSHMAMQEMAGMLGAVIMHPRVPYRPHCDKDYVIHLQEYAVLANQTTPNTMNMEFNWLLLNGKAGPATTPLIVRQGERIRIRFINLGMDHHPMHVHGHTFYTTGTEGGRIPETAWWPGNTVLVGVAQARDVEFVADNPGDWMLHCHLPHHMMNQMSSHVGPMTRAAGYPGGRGMRGDDSHGQLLHPGQQQDEMQGMEMHDMPGMQMKHESNPNTASDSAVPAAALAAGTQANGEGPLANTEMDAGMRGMMQEQSKRQPRMSDLQYRNQNAFDMDADSMKAQKAEISPNANDVPNFPQDAYMEGTMMNMEKLVQKPENLGLRPNWSRFMQGMMTFVRVLPPEQYEQVVSAMKSANRSNDPYISLYSTPTKQTRG
ncbi:MAG: copper oxidase [Acidobacteriaceae bacterium]|nr:copper oxidase [Acidobacteriaceae bacterium]